MSIHQLLSEALKLDVDIRADLIQKLIDSLDNSDIENQWIDLAEKRLNELKTGTINGIPWNEVRKEVS